MVFLGSAAALDFIVVHFFMTKTLPPVFCQIIWQELEEYPARCSRNIWITLLYNWKGIRHMKYETVYENLQGSIGCNSRGVIFSWLKLMCTLRPRIGEVDNCMAKTNRWHGYVACKDIL
jgi:hypothetical protein